MSDTNESQDIAALAGLSAIEQKKMQEAWIHLLRLSGVEHKSDTVPDMTETLRQHLDNKDPEAFHTVLWSYILADHPDAAVLRFMRARKWDMEKSLVMMVSALNWRSQHKIDDEIIFKGESVAHLENPDADEKAFIMQYNSGKSFVRGSDKENRPIYVIRVRLHDPKAQTPEAMEQYVLHNIESLRTTLTFPNDKACLIFDLTNFGLKNMDFHVVKFLVQVFEARYPETLGLVLIHKAPFVFWGIWSIIKGWLDPVIASKINFTNSTSNLLQFIEKDNLQKSYGGEDPWEYKYIDPPADENDRMKDTEKKGAIQAERNELAKQFDQETLDWATKDPVSEEGKEKATKRFELAQKLRQNYLTLDPYIRARTYYHRAGVGPGPNGEVNFKAAN